MQWGALQGLNSRLSTGDLEQIKLYLGASPSRGIKNACCTGLEFPPQASLLSSQSCASSNLLATSTCIFNRMTSQTCPKLSFLAYSTLTKIPATLCVLQLFLLSINGNIVPGTQHPFFFLIQFVRTQGQRLPSDTGSHGLAEQSHKWKPSWEGWGRKT